MNRLVNKKSSNEEPTVVDFVSNRMQAIEGHRLLIEFLHKHALTVDDLVPRLDPRPHRNTVRRWINSERRPEVIYRVQLEQITASVVTCRSWLTEDEVLEIQMREQWLQEHPVIVKKPDEPIEQPESNSSNGQNTSADDSSADDDSVGDVDLENENRRSTAPKPGSYLDRTSRRPSASDEDGDDDDDITSTRRALRNLRAGEKILAVRNASNPNLSQEERAGEWKKLLPPTLYPDDETVVSEADQLVEESNESAGDSKSSKRANGSAALNQSKSLHKCYSDNTFVRTKISGRYELVDRMNKPFGKYSDFLKAKTALDDPASRRFEIHAVRCTRCMMNLATRSNSNNAATERLAQMASRSHHGSDAGR